MFEMEIPDFKISNF